MDIQWDLGLPMLSQVATVLPIVSSGTTWDYLGDLLAIDSCLDSLKKAVL